MEDLQVNTKVKLLEECQISPPLGSVPPRALPLTYFDLRYLDKRPVQQLLFYKLHDHPTTTAKRYFMDTIVPRIKHSLSITLQQYYPLAGKLIWPIAAAAGPEKSYPEPKLVYSDGDTVPFSVVEVGASDGYLFSPLTVNHPRKLSEFYPLYPRLTPSTTSEEHLIVVPLLAIQVTLFQDQGICIGVNQRQVVMDGRTTVAFIKLWASLCRRLMEGRDLASASLAATTLPLYDRSTIMKTMKQKTTIQMIELHEKYKKTTKETLLNNIDDGHLGVVNGQSPADRVQATFLMSHYNVRKLKKWILSSKRISPVPLHQYRLSSLVVTCAYVWVCWIKAKLCSIKNDDRGASEDLAEYLIIPVDARERLRPPLPLTYFGNCVEYVEVVAKRSDLVQQDCVATAANLIARGIQDFDIHADTCKYMSYYTSLPTEQCLLVGNSPKFGVYEIDFGWGGKPKKVELLAETRMRSIFLTESRDEEQGALEFGLVCNPIEMQDFTILFEHFLTSIGSFSLM